MREHLPPTRNSITHKAVIYSEKGKVKFFFTVGLFADGRPGELFLHMDRSGSTLDGFADAWATAISVGLQHGEPLTNVVAKYSHQQFEPSGRTENPDIPFARSVPDYVVRWMEKQFMEKCDAVTSGEVKKASVQ